MTDTGKEILYIADPMCSWCWGFSPVIRRLADGAAHRKVRTRVIAGGLRLGVTTPLPADEAARIVHHWEQVAKTTGQPFDFAQPLDDTFVYDTGPACRAVSLMARTRPQSALDYLHSLHQAFYVGRRDLKDLEVLADYAQTYGQPREEWIARLVGAESHDALEEDLQLVQRLGIRGFPCVVLRDGAQLRGFTSGYQPIETLAPQLDAWLTG